MKNTVKLRRHYLNSYAVTYVTLALHYGLGTVILRVA